MIEPIEEYPGSDPLGENIDIEDWDEIAESMDIPESGDLPDTSHSGRNASGSEGSEHGDLQGGTSHRGSRKGQWDAYPYGTPTPDCHKKLLVDVTAGTAAHYDHLLDYALRHIEHLCPCTELVVFRIHSNVDYMDWIARYRLFWHAHFSRKPAVKFATRVARKWRPGGSATVETGGLPKTATGHQFGPCFAAMFSIKREKLRLRIWLLDSLGHLDDRDNRGCRYIGQYINQPPTVLGGPRYSGETFGFGHLGNTIRGWTARIYLDRQGFFYLGFPEHLYRGAPGTAPIVKGERSWRPANFAGFLLDPLHWVDRA